jgi:hypothetical protein
MSSFAKLKEKRNARQFNVQAQTNVGLQGRRVVPAGAGSGPVSSDLGSGSSSLAVNSTSATCTGITGHTSTFGHNVNEEANLPPYTAALGDKGVMKEPEAVSSTSTVDPPTPWHNRSTQGESSISVKRRSSVDILTSLYGSELGSLQIRTSPTSGRGLYAPATKKLLRGTSHFLSL